MDVGRNSEAHSAKPSGDAADYAPLIRPTLAEGMTIPAQAGWAIGAHSPYPVRVG